MAKDPIPRHTALNTLKDLFVQEPKVLLAYLFGQVIKDGVLIIKDAPLLRVEFEIRTLREYLNTAYLRVGSGAHHARADF